MSSRNRILASVVVGLLVPAAAFANAAGPSSKMVDLGKHKVKLMETVDGGALVRYLPEGVQDPALFEALDKHLSAEQNAQMKARADEAKATAEQTSQSGSDVRVNTITYRAGSTTGWNSSARSYSSHSGYRDRGSWTVTIDASGYSSGSWHGSGVPQHIILNEQLCFSGLAVTVSWPPSLSGSSSCGSYQSSPWSGTTLVSQSYGNAQALSYLGLFGTTQSDSATVRINYHDYRPSSQVSLSFGL